MSEPKRQPNYARRTKIAAGCLGVLGAGLVLSCLGVIVFLFTSCSFNKPLIAAGLPNPDRAYQTGTVVGYNVYVWDCYQGKHIVVYNTSGELYSGPYARQETTCDRLTPLEMQIAKEQTRALDPGSFW